MGRSQVNFGRRWLRAVLAVTALCAIQSLCLFGQRPDHQSANGWFASGVANAANSTTAAAPSGSCAKTDFEQVVEQAAGSLRELNTKNKPAFQEKLRALKDKRGWAHDVFLKEAAPFVRDEKIAEFDQSTDELLTAISTLGQEGASAATPDCAVLLELRARMSLLVDTQTAKWSYMFGKIDTELWK